MTIITDGKDSDHEICTMIKVIETFLNDMDTVNKIPGLKATFFVSTTSLCSTEVVTAAKVQNHFNSNANGAKVLFNKVFWPIIVVVLLVVCYSCYIRITQRKKKNTPIYDHNNKLDDIDTDDDSKATYTERFLDSVDVKVCNSYSCQQCRDHTDERTCIEFVKAYSTT